MGFWDKETGLLCESDCKLSHPSMCQVLLLSRCEKWMVAFVFNPFSDTPWHNINKSNSLYFWVQRNLLHCKSRYFANCHRLRKRPAIFQAVRSVKMIDGESLKSEILKDWDFGKDDCYTKIEVKRNVLQNLRGRRWNREPKSHEILMFVCLQRNAKQYCGVPKLDCTQCYCQRSE